MKLELNTDLLALLPPWYREILDYAEICKTEAEELAKLADAIRTVRDNLFFQTMDAGTCADWEAIFSIVANPAVETTEFRRARLISRMSTRPPFTLRFLERKLDELIGAGKWTVSVDYPNYTLYIESAAESQSYATEVSFLVGRIKPAHIVYVNRPYTAAELEISEEVGLSELVYKYRLGAWGLGQHPFAVGEDKGVIKTATTKSLTAELLADTAASLAANIAAARINGSTVIDTLSKTADGATVTVTYTVPAGDISAVERYELLDADGNVLSAAAVYVPVTGSTVLKHTITVKECA